MDDTLYLVCEDCAHQWNAPEMPDRCENCGRPNVASFDDPVAQDDYSAEVAGDD